MKEGPQGFGRSKTSRGCETLRTYGAGGWNLRDIRAPRAVERCRGKEPQERCTCFAQAGAAVVWIELRGARQPEERHVSAGHTAAHRTEEKTRRARPETANVERGGREPMTPDRPDGSNL
jgi:hypothetical protein